MGRFGVDGPMPESRPSPFVDLSNLGEVLPVSSECPDITGVTGRPVVGILDVDTLAVGDLVLDASSSGVAEANRGWPGVAEGRRDAVSDSRSLVLLP